MAHLLIFDGDNFALTALRRTLLYIDKDSENSLFEKCDSFVSLGDGYVRAAREMLD